MTRPMPPADQAPTANDRWNGRMLNIEAIFMSLAFGAVPGFYALYAIQEGASNSLVGWITSGPALLSLLWLFPCSWLIQRSRSFSRPMFIGTVIHRLMIISMAGLAFLPPGWRAPGLVALATLANIPSNLWGVAQQAAWVDMFSPRFMSRYVSQRWAISGVTGVVAVLLLGKLIDWVPAPRNYQILFFGCGLLTLASAWLQLQYRMPERTQPASPAAKERPPSWPSILRTYRAFALYELSFFFICLSFYAAQPLLRIYWVRDLGAAGGWVGALSAASSVGSTVGTLFLGRFGRPSRNRRIHLAVAIGQLILLPLLTLLNRTLPPLLLVNILGGFCISGNDLSSLSRVVETSSRRLRPSFFAIHTVTFNAAALIAPQLSTGLAGAWGIRPTLAFCASLGVLAAGMVYLVGWRLPAVQGDLAA